MSASDLEAPIRPQASNPSGKSIARNATLALHGFAVLAWAADWPWFCIWIALGAWLACGLAARAMSSGQSFARFYLEPMLALLWRRKGAVFHVVWIAALAFWVVVRLRQWNCFGFSQWSLSLYANVVANTLHGNLLYSSVLETNHLGTHFSPITILFAPLFGLFGYRPAILMIAQSTAVVLTAPLLYVFARHVAGANRKGCAIGAAAATLLLIYEPMTRAVIWDFHPSTLAPPVLILGLIALRRSNNWLLAGSVAAAFCLKESGALMALSFALYAGLTLRRWKASAILAALAGLHALLYFVWIMPAFNPGDWHQASRTEASSWLDADINRMRYVYLWRLFAPLAFVPLMNWRAATMLLPHLALNLATNYQPQLSAQSHYDDAFAPLAMAAIIHALADIRIGSEAGSPARRAARRARMAWALCLLWTPILFHALSPATLYRNYINTPQFDAIRERVAPYALLPYEQPIIAPGRLAALLCNRREVSRRQTQLEQRDFHPGNLIILSPHLASRRDRSFQLSEPLIAQFQDRLETLERDDILWVFRVKPPATAP